MLRSLISRAAAHPLRRELLSLLPLCLALVALGLWAPWRSNFDVDTLTHFEQLRAVSDTGSVGFDNGPVLEFAQLRPRWFISAQGRAWGILPAGFSYLYALPMRWGGYHGTLFALWSTLAAACVLLYALVRRLTGSGPAAVFAAYALPCATSVNFWLTMTAPFVPAGALALAAVGAGARAHKRGVASPEAVGDTLRWSLLAGLFAGLALSCHLVMSVAFGLLGLAMLRAPDSPARLLRGLGFGLGAAAPLGLMAWVNHQRFNTWNPISYGPCNVHNCVDPAAPNPQTAEGFWESLKPVAPFLALFLLGCWALRRHPRGLAVGAFFAACGSFIPHSQTREILSRYACALFGFVVDLGQVSIGYERFSDGPGNMMEGYCVRALLQCAPWLVVALFARATGPLLAPARDTADANDANDANETAAGPVEDALVTLAWAVVLGVLAGCTLRADTGGAYVFGWPFLNLRYVVPLLPCAVLLAASAMARLPWHPLHLAAGGAFALYLGRRYGLVDDADLWRRESTYWSTLLSCAASFVFTGLACSAEAPLQRRAAAHFAAAALTLSLGMSAAMVFGIDRHAMVVYRAEQDSIVHEAERCIGDTRRLVLLGGYALDYGLTLHAGRDVRFINLGMGDRDGPGAVQLLERFEAPDRPAYLLQDTPVGPWHRLPEGWRYSTRLECPRVWRLHRPGHTAR